MNKIHVSSFIVEKGGSSGYFYDRLNKY